MYYTYDEVSIYYEIHGNGKKKMVILPGWGDTRSTFRYLIDYFKNDYQIYILDYPGFGKSSCLNQDFDIFDYAKMISSFLNDLDIKNPILLSHSFGGRIAILLSGYHQIKIDKMIMISSAGIKPKKKLRSIFRTYLYKTLKKCKMFFPKLKREIYLKRLFNYFASSDYNALPTNMMTTFKNIVNKDLTIYLKQMKTETLLLWGKLDEDTPLQDGLKMNELINDSTLIVLEHCSHYVYLQDPNRMHLIIEEFIKE